MKMISNIVFFSVFFFNPTDKMIANDTINYMNIYLLYDVLDLLVY